MLKSKLRTANVDLNHGLTDLNSLIVKNDNLTKDTCVLMVENELYASDIKDLERRNSQAERHIF